MRQACQPHHAGRPQAGGVSVGTVKGYAHNVYQKLGVSGRRRAVARAIELGLLPAR